MDVSKLSSRDRQIRINIRNGYVAASLEELLIAHSNAILRADTFAAECLCELIAEKRAEDNS